MLAFRLGAKIHTSPDNVSGDTVCDTIFSLWRNIFLNLTELSPLKQLYEIIIFILEKQFFTQKNWGSTYAPPQNVIYVNINYTKPEKPINAIARIAAVMSAIGLPFIAAGTPSSSKRSRMPAKSTNAIAKPMAVATEKVKLCKRLYSF